MSERSIGRRRDGEREKNRVSECMSVFFSCMCVDICCNRILPPSHITHYTLLNVAEDSFIDVLNCANVYFMFM